MDQERIIRITTIERSARELEEHLHLIDEQIFELEMFRRTLEEVKNSKSNEVLNTIGGRVFFKAKIEDIEKLYVDVGAGVIIKKTPSEILEIAAKNVKELGEVRANIGMQLDLYHKQLEEFINEVQVNG